MLTTSLTQTPPVTDAAARRQPRVLRRAEIEPGVVKYQVLHHLAVFTATLFLIPVLPLIVPVVAWYYRRYYASLDVRLTTREFQVSHGVLNRQERSIPLEKITDVAVFQGPIMRRLGLKGLLVETAGQTGAGGALVKLVGIVDTDGFRDATLEQRDKVADREAAAPALDKQPIEATAATPDLREIHETLLRIEALLRR